MPDPHGGKSWLNVSNTHLSTASLMMGGSCTQQGRNGRSVHKVIPRQTISPGQAGLHTLGIVAAGTSAAFSTIVSPGGKGHTKRLIERLPASNNQVDPAKIVSTRVDEIGCARVMGTITGTASRGAVWEAVDDRLTFPQNTTASHDRRMSKDWLG